ncbi:hypothetical protein ACQ0QQ_21895 [Lysinibacillus sphaericus]
MKPLLFAAGAFVLLMPFLRFIPVKLTLKQKVFLSTLSFCITILALIGKNFLPFISVLAILVLLTGLTAYIAQSRIPNESTAHHHELHPEPHFPAASHQGPEINDETVNDTYESSNETVSGSNLQEESPEDFIKEDHQDYIKELEWEEAEMKRLEPEAADAHVYEEELPFIDDGLREAVEGPPGVDEEEEEYNRLFSGIKRR